jgi:hypothetical protein
MSARAIAGETSAWENTAFTHALSGEEGAMSYKTASMPPIFWARGDCFNCFIGCMVQRDGDECQWRFTVYKQERLIYN